MKSTDMLSISTISSLDFNNNQSFFSESQDVFYYLGDSLKTHIARHLKKMGVSDQPIIRGKVAPGAYLEGAVFIDEGAVVEPTAYIKGPCHIGKNSEVRHGAYIRGNVYVGQNCIIGHTTEVKGSVFCDGSKAGHFAYVGDSFLAEACNLGAGTKLANLKLSNREVAFIHPTKKKKISSGLRKLGGIIGRDCQTGCNSVISPGTILMPNTHVLPCEHFHGIKFAK